MAQKLARVACLGDSITNGYILSGGDTYPAQLGALLGSKYEVVNYGVNGAGLLSDGQLWYRDTPEYRKAIEDGGDIIVIMIGTNDAWRNMQDKCAEAVTELLAEIKGKWPSSRYIFVLPISYRTPPPEDDPLVALRAAIGPVANAAGCEVISAAGLLSEDEYFDNLHPLPPGAAKIAGLVHKQIVTGGK